MPREILEPKEKKEREEGGVDKEGEFVSVNEEERGREWECVVPNRENGNTPTLDKRAPENVRKKICQTVSVSKDFDEEGKERKYIGDGETLLRMNCGSHSPEKEKREREREREREKRKRSG